jgi:hypothetical protein
MFHSKLKTHLFHSSFPPCFALPAVSTLVFFFTLLVFHITAIFTCINHPRIISLLPVSESKPPSVATVWQAFYRHFKSPHSSIYFCHFISHFLISPVFFFVSCFFLSLSSGKICVTFSCIYATTRSRSSSLYHCGAINIVIIIIIIIIIINIYNIRA